MESFRCPVSFSFAHLITHTSLIPHKYRVRIDDDEEEEECGTRDCVSDERKELQSDACPEIDSVVEKSS